MFGTSPTARCSTWSAVLVHSKDKVGKDAGEIAGIAPIGVIATDDIDAVIAMDADCVFYTPIIMDTETVCRLLRSGKNVVTTSGFFYPTADFAADGAKIRAACQAGGTTFHAGGIHPGYAGDILPLTLARVMSRIDQIRVHEVVNVLADAPTDHIDWMGFGKDKDTFVSEPTILGLGVPFFAQSMYMIADGLGVSIDEVTAADVEGGRRHRGHPARVGGDTRGTVAAQHHEWTAWVDGRPLIVFQALYTTTSTDKLDPAWDFGQDALPHIDRRRSTDRAHPPRRRATRRHHGTPRIQLDRDGRHQRDPRRLRRRTGLAHPPRPRSGSTPWPGTQMTSQESATPSLHHVVFAIALERHDAVAEMFTELGFTFAPAELTELGVTDQPGLGSAESN